ncbi:hypothetical protein LXT21_05380 [Myxococcus sp. K38C18041901]|uniref:hypothetical protein n=1 Tax=Myxococcus guangdongensis TaxID=2906760 RepID=UPI0020A76FB9|nr:hypothetical protein [Myxococcus guangdongensis]MCP3058191.1 hypothetical protein [Myxococcus guangdongensis]
MTSIRRLSSSILSSLRRTSLDADVGSVAPTKPSESLEAVEKVRRGFSDESDFQVDGADGADALFATLGSDDVEPGESRELEHAALRVFSGESSFESAAPRYAQRLGSQLPSSLGAPRDSGNAAGPSSRRGGANVPDASDILSPDEAAWELQNLDTSSPSVDAPEDLLSMLDPPGNAWGPVHPALDLHMDAFEDSVGGADGLDAGRALEGPSMAQSAAAEWMDESVRPAGPNEFLADLNDLGDMVPEDIGPADAALAGVMGSLAANPAAASVPVSAAMSAQGVDVVAEAVELQPDAQPVDTATSLDSFSSPGVVTEASAEALSQQVASLTEQTVFVEPDVAQADLPGEPSDAERPPQPTAT